MGKNRLTKKVIDTLQNYYGMAIQQNTDSSIDTINAVWDSLYHVASSDESPNYSMCPTGNDSWYKWQKHAATYKHTHGLPAAIVSLLEPI